MKHYDYIEAEDLFELASEWIKQREFGKAEHYLKRVLILNPRFIYAYIKLAQIYARKKDFSSSINILKHALSNDPSFHRLHFLMAKYAYKSGDYRLALRYIDRAINNNPELLYLKSRIIIERSLNSLDFFARKPLK